MWTLNQKEGHSKGNKDDFIQIDYKRNFPNWIRTVVKFPTDPECSTKERILETSQSIIKDNFLQAKLSAPVLWSDFKI